MLFQLDVRDSKDTFFLRTPQQNALDVSSLQLLAVRRSWKECKSLGMSMLPTAPWPYCNWKIEERCAFGKGTRLCED